MLLVFILWILPTLFIAGVILMVIGFGGVRRGQTAVCAKCGFELSGTSLDGVCPECGVSLSKPGSWRRGVLHRRPALGVLGLLLVLPFTARSAMWAVEQVSPAALAPYKPLWLLRSDIMSGSFNERGVAITEVERRIVNPGFANWPEVQLIVEDALSIQRDPSAVWDPRLGDLIVAAHVAGRLRTEDYQQFIANGVQYEMKLPANVKAGSEFEVQIDSQHDRLASRSMAIKTDVAIVVNEAPQALPLRTIMMSGGGSFSFRAQAPTETGVAKVKTSLGMSQGPSLLGARLLTASVTIIPADQSVPVEGVRDHAVLVELQRSVFASFDKTDAAVLRRPFQTVTITWNKRSSPSAELDYVVRVVVRGRNSAGEAVEFDVGQLRRLRQVETIGYMFSMQRFEDAGDLNGVTLQDVVLRVDREGILVTPGAQRPWVGEDVVLKVLR